MMGTRRRPRETLRPDTPRARRAAVTRETPPKPDTPRAHRHAKTPAVLRHGVGLLRERLRRQ